MLSALSFDALTTDQLADIFAYLEPDLAADFYHLLQVKTNKDS